MTKDQLTFIRNLAEETLAIEKRLRLQRQVLISMLPEPKSAANRAPVNDYIVLPDGKKLYYGKAAKKRARRKCSLVSMAGGKQCQSK